MKLERTKKASAGITEEIEEEPVLKYQKVGGGSFYMGNRIIKPNEVFFAKASEIPNGFRDVVKLLSDKVAQQPEKPKRIVPKVTYSVVPAEGEEELFNIVDSAGKIINESPLAEDSANELKKQLEAA